MPKPKGKMIKPEGVEHSLDDSELADLVFFSRELKIRQLEAKHWQAEIKGIQVKITERVKAPSPKYVIDWSHVMDTAKVYVLKNKAPKIEIGKEEQRPNGKPELQKKQGKRT